MIHFPLMQIVLCIQSLANFDTDILEGRKAIIREGHAHPPQTPGSRWQLPAHHTQHSHRLSLSRPQPPETGPARESPHTPCEVLNTPGIHDFIRPWRTLSSLLFSSERLYDCLEIKLLKMFPEKEAETRKRGCKTKMGEKKNGNDLKSPKDTPP